jgi:hypothetical protein
MDPTAIRTTYPGAQFVARARLADAVAGLIAPAEVWGILIELDVATAADGKTRDVLTDDGRRFAATVAGSGRPEGEPAAILAAVRYWELPPPYVDRLAAELGETAS